MDDDDNLLNTDDEKENECCFTNHVKTNLIHNKFESNVSRSPKVDDWLLVRFATKKCIKYFVGNITSINENNIPNVKFLRKIKNSRTVSFHYPDVEGISEVKHYDDIVMFLKKPDISRRGHVTFKENFKQYNIQ